MELLDGLLILFDVPLGALIKGLPVTLWGHVRWAGRSRASWEGGTSQREDLLVIVNLTF